MLKLYSLGVFTGAVSLGLVTGTVGWGATSEQILKFESPVFEDSNGTIQIGNKKGTARSISPWTYDSKSSVSETFSERIMDQNHWVRVFTRPVEGGTEAIGIYYTTEGGKEYLNVFPIAPREWDTRKMTDGVRPGPWTKIS